MHVLVVYNNYIAIASYVAIYCKSGKIRWAKLLQFSWF